MRGRSHFLRRCPSKSDTKDGSPKRWPDVLKSGFIVLSTRCGPGSILVECVSFGPLEVRPAVEVRQLSSRRQKRTGSSVRGRCFAVEAPRLYVMEPFG